MSFLIGAVQGVIESVRFFVYAILLATLVGAYTGHVQIQEVKANTVVNVVDDDGKVLFPWVTGENVSYRLVIR